MTLRLAIVGIAVAWTPTSFAGQADELAALRQQLAAQQQQIDELRRELAEQRKLLQATGRAAEPAPLARETSGQAHTTAAPMKVAGDGKPEAPLSFRIGGADFTPGGFLDFTSIYRSTNVGSGIGTSFGSIPFSNTAAGRLSESRFSAQNSRISLKVTAKPGQQSVTGYVEADFLGALPPNGNVTSNSNSFRMRLYWVDVQRGKWEVLGGQSWSMLTPNRNGLSAMPADLFISQDMDTNYQIGLTWSRAPQFRLIYHANKNWTAGVAAENPQQYTGGGVVLPGSFYNNQVDAGANTGTPNVRPDIIAKVAFDGQAGSHAVHAEAAGVLRGFRLVTPEGVHSSAQGYGGSFNANVGLVKNFRAILTSYYSNGGARYIFGLGPDVIVRPNGTLSPVHAGSGIAGFEYQATPASLWYGYYSGAYFSRNYSLAAPGQYVGFGFPGSPSAGNRQLQEATAGLIRTFWKNPTHGALQLITQYSFVTRSPWAAPAGPPAQAQTHMVYADLRYVLP